MNDELQSVVGEPVPGEPFHYAVPVVEPTALVAPEVPTDTPVVDKPVVR